MFKQDPIIPIVIFIGCFFGLGWVLLIDMNDSNTGLALLSTERLQTKIREHILNINDSYKSDTAVMCQYFDENHISILSISTLLDYGINVVPSDPTLAFSTIMKRLSMVVRTLKEIQQVVSDDMLENPSLYPNGSFGYLSMVIEESLSQVYAVKNSIRKKHYLTSKWKHDDSLTFEQIKEIVKHCDAETGLIIKLLFHTGARISALLDLRYDQISILTSGDYILELIGKKQSTKVLMSKDYMKQIELVFPRLPDFPYLFYNLRTGGRLNRHVFGLRLQKVIDTHFPDLSWVTPHTFRRSFAHYLYENGFRYEAISAYLGHSDSEVTKHYLNPEIDEDFLLNNLPRLHW
jgi:hypothetical protein